MKRASHIWRRHDNGERGLRRGCVCTEVTLRFPPAIPAALHFLRIVGFGDFHLHEFVFLSSSRRIFTAISGTTSHAMLSTASDESLRMTRSAILSISSSVR